MTLVFRVFRGNNTLFARRLKYNTLFIAELIFLLIYWRNSLLFSLPVILLFVFFLAFKFFRVPSFIIKEQGTRNPFKIRLRKSSSDYLDKLDYEHFWYAIIPMVIILTIIIGYEDASNKNKFLVISKENEIYIVINKYNDKLICYQIDESKHIISSGFYIKDLKELSEFNFRKESFGYLIYKGNSIIFSEIPMKFQH